MSRVVGVALALALLAVVAAGSPLGPYKVDPSRVTVGGLSAGAFMAVQYHVAFSSEISGAAVFAGGAYYCAQDKELTATTSCMNPNSLFPVPSASSLASFTDLAYVEGHIDNPKNLTDDNVYIYSGILDTVVHHPVVAGLVKYYDLMLNTTGSSQIKTEFSILSEHMYPTLSYGESCTRLGEPYIGSCNYDGAGEALQVLYKDLKPRGAQVTANLMQFSQTKFVADPSAISLNTIGYIYVPTACQSGATCALHISLHGCEQTTADIQEQYPQHVGLNEWAEVNNIIVIYPQVVRSLPSNYMGCWDWWGYTNANYAYQTGPQMAFVHDVMRYVMGDSETSCAEHTQLECLSSLVNMGDSVVGFIGDGFALVAADKTIARGIMTYKHDDDKITKISDKLVLAGAGPVADRSHFNELVAANIKLYGLRSGFECDTKEAAHYCRNTLATALRRGPYNVNVLLAGCDDTGASLYFMDYMASMQKMNFAAHGYAGYFLYALLDRHWKPKMTEPEAMDLIRACIKQLHTRFLLHQPSFTVKIVDKDGVRKVDL